MLEKVIKIKNKSFDDLNAEEVALMIEADSSLSSTGNDYFAACALDEFLYSAQLTRQDLLALRRLVLNNIYIDKTGTREKDINVVFLKNLAIRIRTGDIHIERR